MKMAYLKNLCLFISITAMSAFADTSFTIHWPHHGDRVMKTHYEFVDVPSDTTIWDFSHAIETGERHEMHLVSIGDSLWVKIEQGVQSIYQLHGDTLFWNGYENSLLRVQDSIAPIDVMTVLAKGCSITSPMYFYGNYSSNHAIDIVGNSLIQIGNLGRLILPSDTLDNIRCTTRTNDYLLRISNKQFDQPIDEGMDSLLREVEVITSWFSPFYRYPLVENISHIYYKGNRPVHQSEKTLMCTPDEQEYALGIIQNPDTLLKNVISNNSYFSHGIITMNASLADRTTIMQQSGKIIYAVNGGGGNTNDISVLLCDMQGRIWYSLNNNECSTSCEIDTKHFPPGYYLLQITNGEEKYVEKLKIK
jgi:hypothetical protein